MTAIKKQVKGVDAIFLTDEDVGTLGLYSSQADILALQSANGQRSAPLADGVQTINNAPTNIALLSTATNPAMVFRASVVVVAWSEDGNDAWSVQSTATFQGDGLGAFTLVTTVAGTPQATAGAAAWTAVLTVVSDMPVVQVAGENARTIDWMIFVDNWSAP